MLGPLQLDKLASNLPMEKLKDNFQGARQFDGFKLSKGLKKKAKDAVEADTRVDSKVTLWLFEPPSGER